MVGNSTWYWLDRLYARFLLKLHLIRVMCGSPWTEKKTPVVGEKSLNFHGVSNAFPGAREKDQGSPCWWSLGYRLSATCMFWSLKNAWGAPLHPCHEEVGMQGKWEYDTMIQDHDFSNFRFTLASYVRKLLLGVSYFVLLPWADPLCFAIPKWEVILCTSVAYLVHCMWNHVVFCSSKKRVCDPQNWTRHIKHSVDMSWPMPKCTVAIYEGALPSKKNNTCQPPDTISATKLVGFW